MRYRLDEPHYIDDRYLDTGTEIGDDTPVPYRYTKDTSSLDENGKKIVLPAGSAVPPSRAMTPLDDEAKKLFAKRFPGDSKPDIDPTKPIPVMGNVKTSQPLAQGQPPRPVAHNPAPPPEPNKSLPPKDDK